MIVHPIVFNSFVYPDYSYNAGYLPEFYHDFSCGTSSK